MDRNEKEDQQIKVNEVKTFSVPFALGEIKENISISTNTPSKPSKEEIIQQAFNFHSQGNIQEAAKYYQYFIDQGFRDHRVFSNYGVILKNLGKLQDAELSQRKAIELNPHLAEAHFNLGNTLKDLGKLKDAELSQRKAIEIKPDFVDAYLNLGNILKDLGKLKDAELSQRKAIELDPNLAKAHFNLGSILKDLGNLKDAELSTLKAIQLKPDFADALSNLGLIFLLKGEYSLSLKYYSKNVELNRGEDKNKESNHSRFKAISQYKINHDIEQFEYLVTQGYQDEKFTKLSILYKKCASTINWSSETKLISLSNEYQSILKGTYNRLINIIEAPRLKNEAVSNSVNIERISNDYCNHEFGLTYIDNFLSPLALESLRKFLLGSTIWFNIGFKGGYLGTNLNEGLGNPLIFQIAEELRKKFPKIFKNYPIKQIWAYKYDSRAKNKNSNLSGIHPHADDGAITFNLWITPSDANLNPSSGGLVFHSLEAPKQWDYDSHNSYNHDLIKIQEELKKSKGKTEVIPYKENRAVIFKSHLFHETDNYEFKDGYQNRRINLGILFDLERNS